MDAVTRLAKDRIKKMDKKFVIDHIKRDAAGNIEQFLCRCCGTPIAGFVDDGVVETRMVAGKAIHVMRQKFRSLGNYRQVQFLLDDGSLWEPPVCAGCVPKITESDGEGMFCCHLNEVMKRGNSLHVADQAGMKIKKFMGVKR